jgi:hypothetical protein
MNWGLKRRDWDGGKSEGKVRGSGERRGGKGSRRGVELANTIIICPPSKEPLVN